MDYIVYNLKIIGEIVLKEDWVICHVFDPFEIVFDIIVLTIKAKDIVYENLNDI